MTEQARAHAGEIATTGLGFEIDGARLLADVSIHVGRGEFVGLIGPNGAGKSTLLRTLARLANATSGAITIEGDDSRKVSPREVARKLAFVAQHTPETHGFTALEIVLTGRYPHLGRFSIEGEVDRDIAYDAMARTSTAQFEGRITSSLSGGERQRVFLARGLAQQPRILLLDEPTASLDVLHQFAVMDLARELAREGVTLIAAIHDLAMAARYCDRLVLLQGGRVVANGAPQAVLTPANLGSVFGVTARVFTDPVSGRLAIDFDSAASVAGGGVRGRVHVVSGCGSGARVIRELVRAGFDVTVGPLGAGDIDRLACEPAGVPFLATPGFVPVDDDTHARHLELVRASDVVVVGDLPFGYGNLRNLEALHEARVVVSIESGPFAARDYTSGLATATFERLEIAARCEDAHAAVKAVATLIAANQRQTAADRIPEEVHA